LSLPNSQSRIAGERTLDSIPKCASAMAIGTLASCGVPGEDDGITRRHIFQTLFPSMISLSLQIDSIPSLVEPLPAWHMRQP
jgi:hypothetical protein